MPRPSADSVRLNAAVAEIDEMMKSAIHARGVALASVEIYDGRIADLTAIKHKLIDGIAKPPSRAPRKKRDATEPPPNLLDGNHMPRVVAE